MIVAQVLVSWLNLSWRSEDPILRRIDGLKSHRSTGSNPMVSVFSARKRLPSAP